MCILEYCMNMVIAILCCIWVCCVVSPLCSGVVSLALWLYVAVVLETLVMVKSFEAIVLNEYVVPSETA